MMASDDLVPSPFTPSFILPVKVEKIISEICDTMA